MTNKKHYIDNKKFFKDVCEWKVLVDLAEENEEPEPPVTDYMGECFLLICEHLMKRPNFNRYTYSDDMISDGLESCLLYAHNFKKEKSTNPFSYFTQLVYFAFVRRIIKEQKQSYIRYKVVEHHGVMNNHVNFMHETEADQQLITGYVEYLKTHLQYSELIKKRSRKTKKSDGGLEDFL